MKDILYVKLMNKKQEKLREVLADEDLPYDLLVVNSVQAAEGVIGDKGVDMILLDNPPDERKTYAFLERFEEVPIVILASVEEARIAVQAFRAGAVDYIVKDEKGK